MKAPGFTLERTHPQVVTVRCEVKGDDWHQWFLLTADRHHDNPHTKQELELKHLWEARERGAGIIDAGDLFCAMQGKYDKRADKSCVREEHQCGDYLDALVRTAADFYAPFARNFVVIGRGNHETAIRKNHETDLTDRLIERMEAKAGCMVPSGGYTGWVRIMLSRPGGDRASIRLWYAHGWGGGGQVTKGIIQSGNRMPMMTDGADIVFSGHVHEAVYAEVPRVYLKDSGLPATKTQYIVQTPTYKDEYGSGEGGWHVETGKSPKPLGAWWMRVGITNAGPSVEFHRAT